MLAESNHCWTFSANFLPCPALAHSWVRLYSAYTVKWGDLRISTCQFLPLTLLLSESLIAKVPRFRVSLSWPPLSALHTYAYGWHFDWFGCALGLREKSCLHLICQDNPKWREKYEGAKCPRLEDNGSLNTGSHFAFTLLAVRHRRVSCWFRCRMWLQFHIKAFECP